MGLGSGRVHVGVDFVEESSSDGEPGIEEDASDDELIVSAPDKG